MSRSTSRQINGPGLLRQAHADGDLSRTSLDALELNADIGAQITAALGVLPDDVPASEVVLVSLLVDDSGSIAAAGHEQLLRDGHNLILTALGQSRQTGSVLAHALYLNGTVLYPYRPLAAAEPMTVANYQATGGTPLYDQTAVLLGTVLAFMMSVIALSAPEMIILRKVLKPRLIATFVGIVATGILLVGYVFNLVL